MIGLDSNVVLRFLAHDDPAQTPRAVKCISERTAEDPALITTVVAAETYWVLTRSYKLSRSEAAGVIVDFCRRDEIVAEDESALAFARNAADAGADFADALIRHAHHRAGCRQSVTFDVGAAQTLGFELI